MFLVRNPTKQEKINEKDGKNQSFGGNFRKAIWPFLLIGQIFGVMPVIGVSSSSLSELQFKWISFRTLYSLILASILLSYSMVVIWHTCNVTIKISTISTLLYFVLNTYSYVSFLGLARKWPKLMQLWEITESIIPHFRHQKQQAAFIRKIRFIGLTILFLALVGHFLYVGSLFHIMTSEGDPLTQIVKFSVPYMFTSASVVPIWGAVLIEYISITTTFVWNYSDVFILLISIGLSTQFELFNDELMETQEHVSQHFWAHRRVQYEQLCNLIRTIDKRISHIVFISFSNNLFFICKQLFDSFRPEFPTVYRMIYFWYSLALLILRTVAVSLFAARINDESTKPIWILRSISADSWKTESKRLFNEIVNNSVALSGLQFFFLTRDLILSMAGTIVTYELVLMQLQITEKPTAAA